ncbi:MULTISPECIES: NADH-quinone oxidoreductase subunit L [Micromonospora]|uniref:NADH-quinone oxidoreductase subunit L n=2 Tax=Micromonospora TaxID=1873 RepID=A0ABQ6UHK9_9ACTN|nr:proton-translocating NADH-quinone oxidoreductase, chain L [Micromonospora aurantiaca ATCC 27029]ADU05933.1 proton-translocating NADH-quinone oxidoreductase, chain L [Micromonospora sp. L5]KAB1115309.1 NADH-quinone oxidoreductase subunit L [Micromonospora aurantiaca]OHX04664.1 NADH-quinone oxidoreductase subunit L [Micromonospora sp. WMMB235]MBC9001019.1 NADH-quinone oxidoreductase subunit L [Micromonospora aurantiaca]
MVEQILTIAQSEPAEAVTFATADGMLGSVWLLVAIPLVSAAILLLLGKRADRWGHWLGVGAIGAAFVLGLTYFFQLRGLENKQVELSLWDFMAVGNLKVDFGLLFDPLAAVFVLLITGVGFLIHLYAVEYMAHDAGRRLFFAYFNLFVAAMLLLVLGNNYVMLYFGWEGVGLASYLLISFWYGRPSAATAGKKAFLMNRVGDAGLAIGIFIMFAVLGTTQYDEVFNGVGSMTSTTVLVLGLLLLLGAAGKSGQFPLQAWLPDAMEGPTPVSALIHAATMVTAGVYLIARSNAIFSANETLQLVVVSVGALTLLMGCIIGAAKDDIKRVLAWSTVSQIGYMFLGVGLGGGAYALAIVHLLAHGFFKANMFLGAGSVMHGMNDQVDIRRFGGLSKYMKVTWLTFMMGWLAIIGMFPFSGYFSKEPIIVAAFEREGWTAWLFGMAALLGAGLTAFYMTRLFVLTFHGPKRWTEDIEHPHESPKLMTVPLILLAVGSVGAGFLLATSVPDWLTATNGLAAESGEHAPVLAHWLLTALSLLLTVLGAGLAWFLFRSGTATEPQPAGVVVTAARRNLYTDAFNEAVFEKPGIFLTRALVFLDNRGVDGLVNGLAAAVGGGSGRLRRLQTGFVRSYATSILTGALLVVAAFLAVQAGWLA